MRFKDAASVFSPGRIEVGVYTVKVLPRFGVYAYTLGAMNSYWRTGDKVMFYSFGLQNTEFYTNSVNMITKEFKSKIKEEGYY